MHTCTHRVSAMCKLSSDVCKNENNFDISLYQIYQPKSQENILKYYRLNLFKENIIEFNDSHQITLESPARFFDCLNW